MYHHYPVSPSSVEVSVQCIHFGEPLQPTVDILLQDTGEQRNSARIQETCLI